jgi:tetrapyrrole methylase family protein/MazG family protein
MPSGITIVGLGPGDSRYWTKVASARLSEAPEVYVRTSRHPSLAEISAKIHSFEHLYLPGSDAVEVHQQVAATIVGLGQRPNGVIYAVPGHPALEEPTTPLIRAAAALHGVAVTIIPGLSLRDAVLSALSLEPDGHLQIISATGLAPRHHPPLNPDQAVLITGLASPKLAAQVQQALLNAYAGTVTVTLVQAAGTTEEQAWSYPLAQLAQQPYFDETTSLYLPADPANCSFPTFQETIAHLRAPEGCPWDREQTHQTLRPFLLEEAYEVLEALDAGHQAALAEELGDLLLQIVLHTQIATGAGEFRMGEVIGHINRKLIRRHPHVFGNVAVNGVDDVTSNWEVIKKAEKVAKGQHNNTHSALDGVPAALPALAQALTISKRAVRVGFEWPNIEGVLDKLIEEAHEITIAPDAANLEAEIGDLLFSAVNLARWHNIDPESALRATNARFTRRFKKIEALAADQGKTLSQMSIEEMEQLWQEAKQFD